MLYTAKDIAALCGVTVRAVYARAESRGIPPKKDRPERWTKADARRLAKAGKPGPRKEERR